MNRPTSYSSLLLRLVLISVSCILAMESLRAQFREDFSDADLSANPTWSGTLSSFEVNTWQQLHLKATGAGTAWLSTPLKCSGDMEWRFWIRLSFAPSANNFARIYLLSDQADPSQAANAFYVQLGESGSTDALTLCSREGTVVKTICRGTPGLIANPFTLSVRVTRQANGTWTLAADPQGGQFYGFEGSGVSPLPLFNGYFSLYCQYTASNSQGFYFDNLSAAEVQPDLIPPTLIEAIASGERQLRVTFSEPIERQSAQTFSNFRLSTGTNPQSVSGDPLSTNVLWLNFSQPFPIDQPFTLKIENLLDLNGNRMLPTMVTLAFHLLKPRDVVINELMFDPGPGRQEFVELYNRSVYTFDLGSLSIRVVGKNTTVGKAPVRIDPTSGVLASRGYRVLTANKRALQHDYPLLDPSLVTQVDGLPLLPNDGGMVSLLASDQSLIDSVAYSPAQHYPLLQSTRGVSLERVDPDAPSLASDNWQSAAATCGYATPGAINSQRWNASNVTSSLTIEPESFTPDGDGRDDNLLIHYRSPKPGSLITLLVFNIRGELVRNLASNLLLGSENTFTWNGFTDRHALAPAGIYIILAEIFHPSGTLFRIKRTAILAPTPSK